MLFLGRRHVATVAAAEEKPDAEEPQGVAEPKRPGEDDFRAKLPPLTRWSI